MQDHALYPVDEATSDAQWAATNGPNHSCRHLIAAVGTCKTGTEAEGASIVLPWQCQASCSASWDAIQRDGWETVPSIVLRETCVTDYHLYHSLEDHIRGNPSQMRHTTKSHSQTSLRPRQLIFTARALHSLRHVHKMFWIQRGGTLSNKWYAKFGAYHFPNKKEKKSAHSFLVTL